MSKKKGKRATKKCKRKPQRFRYRISISTKETITVFGYGADMIKIPSFMFDDICISKTVPKRENRPSTEDLNWSLWCKRSI